MFSTYCRLNLHVSASNIDVIRAVRRKLRPAMLKDKSKRSNRHAIYRIMLAHHIDAQNLYKSIQGGLSP